MIECPSCNSTKNKKTTTQPVIVKDSPLSKGYDLYECSECNLLFKNPFPRKDTLIDYYKAIRLENNYWINQTRYPHEKRLDKIIDSLAPGANILDVGCFTGKLLSIHTKHNLYGIEPSLEAARTAEKVSNIKIISDVIDERIVDKFKGFFDLITLVDVFEHLTNPKEYLDKLYLLLKTNGLLIIVTGRTDCITTKIIGPQYWYYIIDSHLIFLNYNYLKKSIPPTAKLEYIPIRHYRTNLFALIKELLWAIIWLYFTPHNKNKKSIVPKLIQSFFVRYKYPLTFTFPKDHAFAMIRKLS